jgi:PAS domain S-box-containing protein
MTDAHSQQELERYRQFFSTSAATIFLKDMQGRYLLVSERMVHALQTSRADLLGKTDADLFAAEVAAALQQHDQQVMSSGQPAIFEEQAKLADGMHTYRTIKFPLFDAQGALVAIGGMALDLTDYDQSAGRA